MKDDRAHRGLIALLLLALFLILLLCHGCAASNAGEAPLDMGVSQKADPHPDQCRGPADLGKEIYWIFFPTKDKDVSLLRSEPILTNRGLLGWHFVCKDHGEERHGFWWEQVPDQERDIP